MTTEEFKKNIIPYSTKLFPMIRRILKDEEESRDAVQDLMLKLWSKRNNLSKCDNINAYVISVTKNYCFDLLKKKRPERININEEFKILNIQSNEKSHELIERHEQVYKIIGNLPDKYKDVIRLRDIDGFTFDEISEMTGFEIPYLRVILSRSRMRVKSELLKIYDYEQGTNQQLVTQVL
jgi:RNA polymerase sigma-70 factor (ECF subfamily)